MGNKKVELKKVNKANNSTVRTLDCHCGCEAKIVTALNKNYVATFL